ALLPSPALCRSGCGAIRNARGSRTPEIRQGLADCLLAPLDATNPFEDAVLGPRGHDGLDVPRIDGGHVAVGEIFDLSAIVHIGCKRTGREKAQERNAQCSDGMLHRVLPCEMSLFAFSRRKYVDI